LENSDKIILDLCGIRYERKIYLDHKGYSCVYINHKEYKVHVLVWQSVFGIKPKGYEIHHKDQDKSNYDIDNLELLSSSDHRRIHAGWVRISGEWTHKPCNKCGQLLPLSDFYYVNTRKIETALCKVCHNETISERNARPELKEKIKVYKRNYYRMHCGKQKERIA
jgi:hypothetical protein